MFKYRDKVIVAYDGKFIEGFVLTTQETNEGDVVYVVLEGRNEKPIAVLPEDCKLLDAQTEKLKTQPPPKRKRGRPRKNT